MYCLVTFASLFLAKTQCKTYTVSKKKEYYYADIKGIITFIVTHI